jgi:hypothetical protein
MEGQPHPSLKLSFKRISNASAGAVLLMYINQKNCEGKKAE